MRILINDYSGHPFQVQLARALARGGHDVLHLYASYFQTPKGRLARAPDDPAGLEIAGYARARPFAKYSYLRRLPVELAYGGWVAERMAAFRPDAAISANMPLDPLAVLQRACARNGVPLVFWLQDIYSTAIDRVMRDKLPVIGAAIGARYARLEGILARRASQVVAITEDFRPALERWGVDPQRITVIENWAPLDDLPVEPRDNFWARRHGLSGKRVLLYSGTLGLKHNPALLLALAQRFKDRDDVRIVVVSEGPGAAWLEARRDTAGNALMVLPFQDFAALPAVLASADVLVAILEAGAGLFSVPSKVPSYLCAGRPILGAMPTGNLAARTIVENAAGHVLSPDRTEAFVTAAETLIDDAALCARLGANARAHAERRFDIGAIAARFEGVLRRALSAPADPALGTSLEGSRHA